MMVKETSAASFFIFAALLLSASACTYKSVRLFNGTGADSRGIVQACNSSGLWSDVCDYNWGTTHTKLVCRQLGYGSKIPIIAYNHGPSPTKKFSFAPSSSYCSSSSIRNCLSSSSWYLRWYCYLHRDTIYIDCNPANTTGGTPGDIRLYNTTTRLASDSGQVQMANRTGHWLAVCDWNWGCDEAVTACKQLGNSNPSPTYKHNGGGWTEIGFGPYSYCSSTRTNLTQCSTYSSFYRRSWSYCNPARDTVHLTCNNNYNRPTCSPNYSVRLVGGNSSAEGRLEICHGGYWKSFCGRSISSYFATTVCNQLGYTDNNFTSVITGRYGCGNISTFVTGTYCRNRVYNRINYCSIYGGSVSSSKCLTTCSSYCTGIKCHQSDNCNEGAVRLADGRMEREGRLEVCINGVWATVCSRYFRRSSAYVACKQAGYNDSDDAVIYTTSSAFGDGGRPVGLSNVDCFGSESTLTECRKLVYPSFSCSRSYIIGLRCLDLCEEGQVRLVNGSGSHEGTVEICVQRRWKLVSENSWDDRDARVVCRQLNHRGGRAVLNSRFGKPRRRIVYNFVNCRGTEFQLRDCSHTRFSPERTIGDVAGVTCDPRPTATVAPPTTPRPTTLPRVVGSIDTSMQCNTTTFALEGCSQACRDRSENCIGSKLTEVGNCMCSSCTESRSEPSIAMSITFADAVHYRCGTYCKQMKKCFDGVCDRTKGRCVCRFCSR